MNVVVTGASGGIGAGIAEVLAETGYGVGLLARSEAKLAAVASEIRSAGGRAATAVCDLRDPDATRAAIDRLASALGGLDALINNAGLVIRKDIYTITIDEWRAQIDTNVNGLFYATRAALPYMKDRGRGHIINISSISGRLPLPGGSGYAATKYAVTGFSESLFHELRNDGIKVTVIYPGSVDSASHRHDPAADHSWKVAPREIGEACRDVLRTAPGTCIHHLEIRPLRRGPD